MRYTLASLASLAATTQALGPRGEQCSFHLKAAGSVSGDVGQLGSGQTRIGLDPATFKLDGDTVSDTKGRGCWWTPPTKVFQCDEGQTPEKGWKIECDGSVSFNGQKDFYQCDAENGQYNIYLEDGHGKDCAKVTLTSDGCAPECPKEETSKVEQPQPTKETQVVTEEQPKPSKVTEVITKVVTEDCSTPPAETKVITKVVTEDCSTPPAETKVVTEKQPAPSQETKVQTMTKVVTEEQPKPPKETQPSPPKQSQPPKQGGDKSCPTDLSGAYEYPHLIIPVDSSNPDKAAGTSYNGQIDSKTSSIFNFDIPGDYKGKTCSLVFLFPKKEDLETSDWKMSGSGEVDFCKLDGVADEKTTANNAPGVEKDLKTVKVEAGNGYSIATFDCPAGEAVSYEMKAKADTSLWFFEDYNPSPLGLYITVC
ncbi:hypothetical protein ACHAQH_004913 [Verticillium albo-atrum]